MNNVELFQVILWITIPALVLCGIGLFLLSTVGEKGKLYSIDDTFLYIYGMCHKLHPKKIRLSNIDEVIIYHSWLEPGVGGRWLRGQRWTVRMRYSKERYTRFMLSDQDTPDYKLSVVKDIFGYSAPAGADQAVLYILSKLKSHGIKCKWNR